MVVLLAESVQSQPQVAVERQAQQPQQQQHTQSSPLSASSPTTTAASSGPAMPTRGRKPNAATAGTITTRQHSHDRDLLHHHQNRNHGHLRQRSGGNGTSSSNKRTTRRSQRPRTQLRMYYILLTIIGIMTSLTAAQDPDTPTTTTTCPVCVDVFAEGQEVFVSPFNESTVTRDDVTMSCQDFVTGVRNGTVDIISTQDCTDVQTLLQLSCGCDDVQDSNGGTDTTHAPTHAPTQIPPSAMPTQQPTPTLLPLPDNYCYNTTKEIIDRERWFFEYGDVNVPREYVICSNTYHDIGPPTNDPFVFLGDSPILVQANVVWKCGFDGKPSNNCILNGGRAQLNSFGLYFPNDHVNVHVHGFTFQDSERLALIVGSPGDITFHDCVFQDQAIGLITNVVFAASANRRLQQHHQRHLQQQQQLSSDDDYKPYQPPSFHLDDLIDAQEKDRTDFTFTNQFLSSILHDNYDDDDNHRQLQSGLLNTIQLNFLNCTFQNIIVTDDVNLSLFAMTFCSPSCEVVFDSCIFKENRVSRLDLIVGGSIRFRQGTLSIRNSCFISNNFIGHNVVRVGDGSTEQGKNTLGDISNNYGTEDGGLFGDCQFVAEVEPGDAIGETTECIHNYDAAQCVADPTIETKPPTPLNTNVPVQTMTPTLAPTSSASNKMSSVLWIATLFSSLLFIELVI
mmetsp:Transcript_24010/g.67698  ORF Transcript_24010/g.67698 Transcript_24010/m.67698 type:complete len:678 (-) Transcript_24010:117-2150(-)|eukprot:CAMPEP_0119547644 /NCGR_PEP_ID=MMETSP1352-20130426/1704_1 /TAXON_ID=265584 /ORGANISM="Stauroneis constricta, Strain CCMP1120" /LENGTH=677 /DNA_ID=CAMNT_0007592617 /DNA_START=444 /DNA_END=2480 /DNA_ORIENTATION=-